MDRRSCLSMTRTTTMSLLSTSLVLLGVNGWFLYTLAKRLKSKECREGERDENAKIPPELSVSVCPYGEEVRVAVDLALICGANMYGHCDRRGTAESGGELGIETKGRPEDFCTAVDVENEEIVTKGLRKAFPAHAVIGEESVGSGPIPRVDVETPTWIVDPIDGTTNFAAGLPLTCVSLGLCVRGVPTVGVVYVPMTRELYIGVMGHGSYRNGMRIFAASTTKTLKNSIVCCEFGYTRDADGVRTMVSAVEDILNHGCRAVRQLGSGVLDLCYVATGRLDIVYAGLAGEGWKPWDYCAGVVIATEAGCSVQPLVIDCYNHHKQHTDTTNTTSNKSSLSTQQSHRFDIYSDSIVCAVNVSIMDELRTLIVSNRTTRQNTETE